MSENDPGRTSDAEDGGSALDLPTREAAGDPDGTTDSETSIATTSVEEPLAEVYVALYDITPEDAAALDEWEGSGLGLYRKLRVRVATLDEDVVAWLYVLDAYEGGLPSARYLGLVADAAEAAGAPDDYVRAIRETPCRSVGP